MRKQFIWRSHLPSPPLMPSHSSSDPIRLTDSSRQRRQVTSTSFATFWTGVRSLPQRRSLNCATRCANARSVSLTPRSVFAHQLRIHSCMTRLLSACLLPHFPLGPVKCEFARLRGHDGTPQGLPAWACKTGKGAGGAWSCDRCSNLSQTLSSTALFLYLQ